MHTKPFTMNDEPQFQVLVLPVLPTFLIARARLTTSAQAIVDEYTSVAGQTPGGLGNEETQILVIRLPQICLANHLHQVPMYHHRQICPPQMRCSLQKKCHPLRMCRLQGTFRLAKQQTNIILENVLRARHLWLH